MQGQYPGDRSGTYGQAGGDLSGTPTWTVLVGSVPFTRRFFNNMPLNPVDPPAMTLHLDAGDSTALAVNEDWHYNLFTGLTDGYYMIRVEGTGTLQVSDTYDDGYYYPGENPGVPWSWTVQSLAGSDGQFRYYHVNPAFLDASHLWLDGQVLIKLECTSGTVDITWAGMRINQVQGYYDAVLSGTTPITTWSANQPASAWEPFPDGTDTYAITTVGSDQFWTVDGTPVLQASGHDRWQGSGDSFTSPQDSLDAANADFHSNTTLNTTAIRVSTAHVPISLIPPHWDSFISDGVNVVSAPTKSVLSPPPAVSALPPWVMSSWEWLETDTYMLGWYFYGQDDVRDDGVYDHSIAVAGDADDVSLVYHLHNTSVNLDTAFPDPTAGTVIASGTSADVPPGSPPSVIPITSYFITTTFNLVITQLALARRTVAIEDKYTFEYGYTGGVGTEASMRSVRESDGTVNTSINHVVARYRRPTWRYAMPVFSLGWNLGKLKLRMPDNTWRILGNPNDTGGRLKIQTPDLTWWQEYRTTDGAVPTHPLKLYTAGGWVVVADLTPD